MDTLFFLHHGPEERTLVRPGSAYRRLHALLVVHLLRSVRGRRLDDEVRAVHGVGRDQIGPARLRRLRCDDQLVAVPLRG